MDLPEPPKPGLASYLRAVGPGVILGSMAAGSGERILLLAAAVRCGCAHRGAEGVRGFLRPRLGPPPREPVDWPMMAAAIAYVPAGFNLFISSCARG